MKYAKLRAILEWMNTADPRADYLIYYDTLIAGQADYNGTLQTIDDILSAWRAHENKRGHRAQAKAITRIKAKILLLYD